MARKPRLLVLAAALALAFSLLALTAAEALAGSSERYPPEAALMKGPELMQTRGFYGGSWCRYPEGGGSRCDIYDNFGLYYFPKADAVRAGARLHVRFAKSERPSNVAINAWPKAKLMKGQPPGYDRYPAGKRQRLKHTFRKRVECDGKTMAWDVFFRVNDPERQYYLVVHAGWRKVPGKKVGYGAADYPLHVRTR
jgi:hypothetical protein